jgi:hypothetical protein
VAAAVATNALAVAPAPPAATLTELVNVPGNRIMDATADRVFYRPLNSVTFNDPLTVRTVSPASEVTIPVRAGREVGSGEGVLIPDGVLFSTESPNGNANTSDLDEWKTGDSASTLAGLDNNAFLATAGDYAVWSSSTTLTRRRERRGQHGVRRGRQRRCRVLG